VVRDTGDELRTALGRLIVGPLKKGVEYMSTTKTLALAAFAAMSLGIGGAMAQEGPSAPDPNYGPAQQFYSTAQTAPVAGRSTAVQSGSSDVDTARAFNPGHYNYGDLANPG
jgi:hypothetical protein